MNATYGTFANHPRASTNDIAFLTIADISEHMGISKSKLYKDIREGRLIAEKSLDDTLVVSPSALKSAYEKFDTSIFFETDLPSPDCLEAEEDLIDSLDTEDIFETPFELCQEISAEPLPEEMTKNAEIDDEENPLLPEKTAEIVRKSGYSLSTAKIMGFFSAVIFCSAILIGVLGKF